MFHAVSFGAFTGWVVLAIGAYVSGVLGRYRAAALALMSALMLGTLKGTDPTSIISVAGLLVAFVPLGIDLLRHAPAPGRRIALVHGLGAAVVIAVFFFLGPRA